MTGAGGMLGKALVKACSADENTAIALTREELDITDADAVNRVLRTTKSDVLVNCAAFTDVDGAEANIKSAFNINEHGVAILAEATANLNIKFITISTDYVFDGTKGSPYTVSDEPKPEGIYGKSKLAGEKAAFALNKNSAVVRVGWLFGTGGTNFLSVMPKLLREGRKCRVIDDAFGIPTYAGDVAEALVKLAIGGCKGIWHVTNNGGGASFYEYGLKVCEYEGFDTSLLVPVNAVQLRRAAVRPHDSRLASNFNEANGFEPLPEWKSALAMFLKKEKRREARL